MSAPVARVRRQPKGRHTSRIGSSSARCCLLAQARASGMTAHQARSSPHEHRPPDEPGQQQRLGPGLVDLGEGARGEQQDARWRPPPPRSPSVRGPAGRQQPGHGHERPDSEGPADVTGQPPARREQHRRPRQVGEGVLDAGGAGPGHRIDVLAARQAVAGLLQGHPDVDPRGRVRDDRRGRRHRIRDDRGDRRRRRRPAGATATASSGRAREGAGQHGGGGRRAQPGAAGS